MAREKKKRQKHRQNLTESLTPPSTPTTSPPFEIKARRESRKAAGRKRVRKERSAVYRHVEKLKVKLQTNTREAERYKKTTSTS
ncbi:hypothetical protein DPMN_106927 [Dreissena polymorpha]|uniref:Uncharacterized protein n=1 Tax=Dreissena polymorpha TaxID=45954 RepID=A0A9D4K5U1_DREPO|nr:hypothetical protein DPMN_106927 [Dreissena polymorpha]